MFGFLKKKKKKILPPLKGEVVAITQVSDPVFSDKMLGDGFAIKPSEDKAKVVSPVDGTIIQLFPTYHAIGIASDDEVEILIHIGIDTVELKGEGFNPLIKQGDKVKAGDVLMEVDFTKIKEKGKETITPVVFTSPLKSLEVYTGLNPEVAAEVEK